MQAMERIMPNNIASDLVDTVQPPLRCLTIDVEEYFHIEAAYDVIHPQDWSTMTSRVDRNINLLLEIFERHHCRATFFFLGDVARRHQHLARRCVEAGHEVASHGMMHDRLHRLGRDHFRNDLQSCKKMLEDQTGKPVLGYRAPTWSITRKTRWAIDVLLECDIIYDASIFPTYHPQYGVPDAPLIPYFLVSESGNGRLLELPPLVWHLGGRNLPVAGGGYFRLLPLRLMESGLKQADRDNRPAIIYFHPWEFDPQCPRMPLTLLGRIRTYTGLSRTQVRLENIIRRYQPWSCIKDQLDRFHALANNAEPFSLSEHYAASNMGR